jgi:hypothetical protein
MPDKKVWRSAPTASDRGRSVPVSPVVVPLPEDCLAYLRATQIPVDIIADIQASSYAGWIELGPLSLLSMPELVNQTTGILPCIKNGYLALASGANGDPVCVHRETRKMVFVSHDTLWDEEWDDFLECVLETPYCYDEFWERVVADKDFPWDYYEAQRRWQPPHGDSIEAGPRLWNPDT